MKPLGWLVLPTFASISAALAIPTSTHNAVAGTIASVSEYATASANPALAAGYEKLEILKDQLAELHNEVLRQEHDIFLLIQKDFNTCTGVRCYLQTAVKTAPDFLQLVKTHFRHSKNEANLPCPWSGQSNSVEEVAADTVEVTVEDILFASPTGSAVLLPTTYSSYTPSISGPSPATTPSYAAGQVDANKDQPATPDVSFDENLSTTSYDHSQDSSWQQQHENKFGDFRMPHPAPRHKHFKLIVATTATLASLIIIALLLKALHHYCTNPRVRADRAARREERRTIREFRRAACQHRIRQIFSRFAFRRHNNDTPDYEEKRAAIILDHNSHLMGTDIASFINAHQSVSRRIKDDESNADHVASIDEMIGSARRPHRGPRSLRTLRSVSTLPLYSPAPPEYNRNLGSDVEIIAGFEYTPSNSDGAPPSSAGSFIFDDGDLCTESSVVDCRSRLSVDTEPLSPSQIV